MRRVCLFLLVLSVSPLASAETYYWEFLTSPQLTAPTPAQACQQRIDWRLSSGSTLDPSIKELEVKQLSSVQWQCLYGYRNASGSGYLANPIMQLRGTVCEDPDAQLNSATGECEAPNRCLDTEGVTTLHMFQRATRANAYDPWPETGDPRPVTVCKDECRYSASGYTGEDTCGALIKDPLIQACITPYIGQGIPCVHGDADHQSQLPSFDPGENPQPDPPTDPEDPTDPAVLCNKTPGFVWSGSVCTPIFSEDSPEPNPDQPNPGTPGGAGEGSGDGGEGDGGEGGGGEGGGTGTGGTGSGGGGGSQSENPNNVLGTECDQALQCTADAYQCAILYQTKRSRCDMEKALDFEEQRPQIEALFTGEDFQMDEEEIDIPSFIGQGARFLPATCPAPISIPLSGNTFQLQMEPFCTFASDLGFLIVAFATLASALYIGRAFGGE